MPRHTHSVKFVARAIVLSAALAACGKSTTSTPTAVDVLDTTTTSVAVTSTTRVPTPDVDEKFVECDVTVFKTQFKTGMRMERCTDTWATGLKDRDTWNCPSEGCTSVDIFHLVNGTWTITATCYKERPIFPRLRWCYTGLRVSTDGDLPGAKVSCKLWDSNSSLRYVWMTGCPPRDIDVRTALARNCKGSWTHNEYLPFETCDSGWVVKRAQKYLKAQGFKVDVDGFYGSAVTKVIAAYQEKNNIVKTGVLDINTWKSITSVKPPAGTDENGDGVITPDEMR